MPPAARAPTARSVESGQPGEATDNDEALPRALFTSLGCLGGGLVGGFGGGALGCMGCAMFMAPPLLLLAPAGAVLGGLVGTAMADPLVDSAPEGLDRLWIPAAIVALGMAAGGVATATAVTSQSLFNDAIMAQNRLVMGGTGVLTFLAAPLVGLIAYNVLPGGLSAIFADDHPDAHRVDEPPGAP